MTANRVRGAMASLGYVPAADLDGCPACDTATRIYAQSDAALRKAWRCRRDALCFYLGAAVVCAATLLTVWGTR